MQKSEEDRTEREMFDLIKIISEFKFPSAHSLMKERLYRADIVELSKKAKYKFIKKGTSLFRYNDAGEDVYFLMYGRLTLSAPEHEKPCETCAVVPKKKPSTFVTEAHVNTRPASARKAEIAAVKREPRQLSPEVKKHFNDINQMITKLLDTKAVESIREFRKMDNYLYGRDFTETFEDKLNRKYASFMDSGKQAPLVQPVVSLMSKMEKIHSVRQGIKDTSNQQKAERKRAEA